MSTMLPQGLPQRSEGITSLIRLALDTKFKHLLLRS